jgi:hypothetical protein
LVLERQLKAIEPNVCSSFTVPAEPAPEHVDIERSRLGEISDRQREVQDGWFHDHDATSGPTRLVEDL